MIYILFILSVLALFADLPAALMSLAAQAGPSCDVVALGLLGFNFGFGRTPKSANEATASQWSRMPAWQLPFLQAGMDQAANLYGQPAITPMQMQVMQNMLSRSGYGGAAPLTKPVPGPAPAPEPGSDPGDHRRWRIPQKPGQGAPPPIRQMLGGAQIRARDGNWYNMNTGELVRRGDPADPTRGVIRQGRDGRWFDGSGNIVKMPGGSSTNGRGLTKPAPGDPDYIDEENNWEVDEPVHDERLYSDGHGGWMRHDPETDTYYYPTSGAGDDPIDAGERDPHTGPDEVVGDPVGGSGSPTDAGGAPVAGEPGNEAPGVSRPPGVRPQPGPRTLTPPVPPTGFTPGDIPGLGMGSGVVGSPLEQAMGGYLGDSLSGRNTGHLARAQAMAGQYGGMGQIGFGALGGLAQGGGNPNLIGGAPDLTGTSGFNRNTAMSNPFAGRQADLTGTSGFNRNTAMSNPFAGRQANMGGLDPFSSPHSSLSGGPATHPGLEHTAGGAYLGRNPFLDAQFSRAADAVTNRFDRSILPGVNATFGSAGRTGSGIHQQSVLNRAEGLRNDLSGLAASIYGPAYESERGRQLSASGALAGLADQERGRQYGLYGGERGRQLSAGLQRSELSDRGLGREYDLYGSNLGRALTSGLQRSELSDRGLGREYDLYGSNLGRALTGGLQGNQIMDAERARMNQNANLGLDRQLSAAQSLGQFGLGATGLQGDLFSRGSQHQLGAAGMVPSLSGMEWNNLGRQMGVANQMQMAPWQQLGNYWGIVGNPAYRETTGTSQMRGKGGGFGFNFGFGGGG